MNAPLPTDEVVELFTKDGNLRVPKHLLEAAMSAGNGGPTLTKEQWMQCAQISAIACAQAAAEVKRLREALQIIASGTICPELFPEEKDEDMLQLKTAMVTAIAALEPKHVQ